jgi:hypothetical protein
MEKIDWKYGVEWGQWCYAIVVGSYGIGYKEPELGLGLFRWFK